MGTGQLRKSTIYVGASAAIPRGSRVAKWELVIGTTSRRHNHRFLGSSMGTSIIPFLVRMSSPSQEPLGQAAPRAGGCLPLVPFQSRSRGTAISVAPPGAHSSSFFFPWLSPWATFYRRCAACISSLFPPWCALASQQQREDMKLKAANLMVCATPGGGRVTTISPWTR